MGVKGLWRLLLPIGRRVSIESLSHSTLAIDASIWLIQFIKANRDPVTGKVTAAAHIIGFFRRICRLLFHQIRPIFVFDGTAPEIKRRELRQRQAARHEFHHVSDMTIQRTARKLIQETLLLRQPPPLPPQQQPTTITVAPTAFVPGFNPGGTASVASVDAVTAAAAAVTRTASDTKVAAVIESEQRTKQQDDSNGITLEPTGTKPQVELNENDGDENANTLQCNTTDKDATITTTTTTRTSDWDIPLAVAEMEDAKEEFDRIVATTNDDDDDYSAVVEYDDYMPPASSDRLNHSGSKRNLQRGRHRAGRWSGVENVHDILASHLSPMDRKDAIEEIQRQQRLDSRREFLPAADDMIQFSQVQMKHFLKSCHVKRQMIHLVQQQADGDGSGNVMASDNTTRLELIYEPPSNANPITNTNSTDRRYDTTTSSRYPPDRTNRTNDYQNSYSSSASLPKNHKRKKNDPTTEAIRSLFQTIDHEKNTMNHDYNDHPSNRKNNTSTTTATTTTTKPEIVKPETPWAHAMRWNENDTTIKQPDKQQPALGNDDATTIDFTNPPLAPRRPPSLSSSTTTAAARTTAAAAAAADDTVPIIASRTLNTIASTGSSTPSPFHEKPHRPRHRRVIMDDDDEEEPDNVLNDEIRENVNSTKPLTAWNSVTAVPTNADFGPVGWNIPGDDKDADDTDNDSGVGGGGFFVPESTVMAKMAENPDVMRIPIHHRHTHPNKEFVGRDDGDEICYGEGNDDDEDVDWEDGDDNFDRDNDCDVPVAASAEHGNADFSHDRIRRTTVLLDDNKYLANEDQDDLTTEPTSFKTKSQFHSAENHQLQFSSDTSDALIRAQETASKLGGWAGGALRRAILEANGGTATAASTVMVDRTIDVDSDDDESDNDDDDIHNAFVLPLNHENTQVNQTSTSGEMTSENMKSPQRPIHTSNKQTNRDRNISWNDITVDADCLEQNDAQWAAERNRRERDAETISDEMLLEVKQLLELFGIPYLVAPAEAESQCVALERLGMVNGIVTDDSDAFVFGGKVIYKNIFDEQKYTEVFNADDAAREMRLDQNSMVALAMLLGSDYTVGVKGVGIVNAMEILKTFDVSQDLKSGLTAFRTWLDGFDPPPVLEDSADENDPDKVKVSTFHMKHKTARTRWVVPQHFPADNVIKAYVDPVVDKSTDKFSWGAPDIEKIIIFCNKHIGWAPDDTKRFLEPVIQSRNNRTGFRQTRIDSYMRYEDGIKFADVRSKRLRDVLGLKDESSDQQRNNNTLRKKKN